MKCVNCDRVLRDDVPLPVRAQCRNQSFSACVFSMGLGSRIARRLSRIGLKKCGGCGAREEKLNRVGEWLSKRLGPLERWLFR